MITSFAAFKRALAIGQPVHIENKRYPHMSRDTYCTRVQTNAIATVAYNPEGVIVDASWIYFEGRTKKIVDGVLHLDDDMTIAIIDGPVTRADVERQAVENLGRR